MVHLRINRYPIIRISTVVIRIIASAQVIVSHYAIIIGT